MDERNLRGDSELRKQEISQKGQWTLDDYRAALVSLGIVRDPERISEVRGGNKVLWGLFKEEALDPESVAVESHEDRLNYTILGLSEIYRDRRIAALGFPGDEYYGKSDSERQKIFKDSFNSLWERRSATEPFSLHEFSRQSYLTETEEELREFREMRRQLQQEIERIKAGIEKRIKKTRERYERESGYRQKQHWFERQGEEIKELEKIKERLEHEKLRDRDIRTLLNLRLPYLTGEDYWIVQDEAMRIAFRVPFGVQSPRL